MRLQVGTDVGGTFTDLWALTDEGRTAVVKAPSTGDIITGILDAIALAAAELDLSTEEFCRSIHRFGHGTTAGLNALLTKTLPPTGVITTAGFGDTFEIGRMKRQVAGLSDLEIGDYLLRGRWSPIVPRSRISEVPERIDRAGDVVQGLDEQAATRAVDALLADGVEAVAVCLLWSTANPVHELRLRELIRERDDEVFVVLSHEVAPVVGEFARMSTTAVNAALGPVIGRYLARLNDALEDRGLTVPVDVMTGAGGVVRAEEVVATPAAGLMSGPAAGVVSSRALGFTLGHDRILSVDVGGTSFDVGVIIDGEALMRSELSVAGADIRHPTIDVATIGAGGGSIARAERGALRVGPRSAGSDPGPTCYGRGGTEPTATDADLLLGVFAAEDFGSGGIELDVQAAEKAISTHVAEPLGLSVVRAAWGIRRVLDSRMADLLRSVTIERGHDPREFVMYANGGQGPAHAWALAQELGIRTVVIAPTSTVQSAVGTATSVRRRTAERSVHVRLPQASMIRDDDMERLRDTARAVVVEIEGTLGGSEDEVRIDLSVSVRYRGQAHSLDVPLADVPGSTSDVTSLLDRFEQDYEALFGRGAAFPEAGYELLAVRAIGTLPLPAVAEPDPQGELAVAGERPVVFDDPDEPVTTSIYRTQLPRPGQQIAGPALVVFTGQTAVIPPGATARTAAGGTLVLELADTTQGDRS